MATNFFERQDQARRLTVRLLVLFALAVVAIIAVIYFVAVMGMAGAQEHYGVHAQVRLWNPLVLGWVTIGTLLVVGMASLYKIAELSSGGEQIALMLGGRPVNPQTTDLAERRLLNVVEEMALASGMSVPPVYVLDGESGINAFAAGHQPGDAVVAVSAGCLRYLTREELQGVMGHEFSHILNGDMRLNLRLIGIVYGILVLAVIGYYMMRIAGSSRGSRKDNGAAGFFILGLALLILGYIGVFFGNLIKAAINRQREFLADASAVQFTRYPGGIAGALKKIGGLSEGSHIRDAHASEVSHMFFGDAFAGLFFNPFATHPPLAVRIQALEPDFDGRFPEVEPLVVAAEGSEELLATPQSGPRQSFAPAETTAAALSRASAIDTRDMLQRTGRPQAEHLCHASETIGGMPQSLVDAAREPFLAQAVIYALLLSRDDEATRNRQLQLLQSRVEPPLFRETRQLTAATQSLSAAARLPLVAMTAPAIRRSSPQQYAQFRQVVDALVSADGKIDLFEYCLRTVLFSSLDVPFGLKRTPAVRYRTIDSVAKPLFVVLSTLAHVGQKEPGDAERAFQAGAQKLLLQPAPAPPELCTLQAFDAALTELAAASPNVKQAVIGGVTACIAADGRATLEESELLRAIAAVLGCPLPPMAATAD
jgi:Zn-dependent protease with chaperone function